MLSPLTNPVDVRGPATPAAPQFDLRRMPRFGVALFDNDRDMSSGWACEGEGTPFYFTSVNGLSSDTIWVTSLDWNEYKCRGQKQHNLRRVDYLRTSLGRIAADMGVRITGEFAEQGSALVSKVVTRAVQIAALTYGWEDPAAELREDTLYEDIRRTIVQAPKPQRHVGSALLSAHQSYSSPDWSNTFEEDSIHITLRYNRLEYAAKLLSMDVPDEGWTLVSGNRASELSLDRLLDPAHPCLVEATVELGGCDPDTATLASFGAQLGKRSGVRKWISQPELTWLSRHARVHVASALISRAPRPLPAAAKLPAAMTADPAFALSLSAGLVAESHIHALSATTYSRATKSSVATAWAVWIKALDRSLSFDLAHKVLRARFLPLGYGSGSVLVRCARKRLPELLEFAESNGIAHPSFYPIFQEHGLV